MSWGWSMASLSLGLLGPFHAASNGRSLSNLTSDRLRALLAYLVVEADRDHLRQTLGELIFPDTPRADACSSLRFALSNLRTAIGDREASPPFLSITRETLRFNPSSHYWLDTAVFETLAGEENVDGLAQAVTLYRGPFLEGINVADSEPLEEWLLSRREQYDQVMMSILRRLGVDSERRGDYVQAQCYARRLLEIDPWSEHAHRQLMRALALSGKRGAAMAQYHNCQRALAHELGAEPEDETTALYERIRLGQLAESRSFVQYQIREPVQESPSVALESPFVDRGAELATLQHHLEATLRASGRVVFVTGGPGSGKTALLNEFAAHARAGCDNLIVVAGSCPPHIVTGGFSLPVCQMLNQLAGNPSYPYCLPASIQSNGPLPADLVPVMIQILTELGPALLNMYVPIRHLISAANNTGKWPKQCGVREEWVSRLLTLAHNESGNHRQCAPQQSQAAGMLVPSTDAWSFAHQVNQLEQLVQVTLSLSRHYPLVVLLDNLQWADIVTVRFLDNLGGRLSHSRILVVGTYRPNELPVYEQLTVSAHESISATHQHPLQHTLSELQRLYGDIVIDLDGSDARQFVDEFLGLAPNCFDDAFRERFAEQTDGNPLLTSELWQDFVARKALIRDAAGRWAEGPKLEWETIPVRARAAIGEEIAALPESWREMLAIASVQGDLFCAEVVATIRQQSVESVIRALSGPLSHEHRLVRGVGVAHVQAHGRDAGQCISNYRFRHHLYRLYLYEGLDQIRRMRLHEAVGRALEALYQDCSGEMRKLAPQLANHFEKAGMPGYSSAYRKRTEQGS